jgi:solute carrier family 25 carnitine/acylcarnitine transporter 20/29
MTQDGVTFTAIAGANAGVAGTLLGYPLDNIKTRMQTGEGSSMLGVGRDVVRREGFRALYIGVANPLIALTILNTLNFSQYAKFRDLYKVRDSILQSGGFEWKTFLAGASVGPLSSLISTPFELVKTQMVLHAKDLGPGSNSSISSAIKIAQDHGFTALYTGHAVNSLREMVFIGCYFTLYEHTKEMWNRVTATAGMPTSAAIPLAGGVSGATSWFISFPLDCIKSNIQGRSLRGDSNTKMSALEVASKLVRERGVAGLYRGASPSIARAFLVSSSRFTVYEGTLSLLRRSFRPQQD